MRQEVIRLHYRRQLNYGEFAIIKNQASFKNPKINISLAMNLIYK